MKEKKLLWIIAFNLVIIVSEIAFGLISNSFSLIADALHNAGDVIALLITYVALKLGSRQSTFKYTFGFLRAEMMAAFTNTLFLFATMIYLTYEALHRLFDPQVVEPVYMMIVGFIALLANGISAYLLKQMGVDSHSHEHNHAHDHHHEDANVKSAYLHMLSDALISVGVVIAGVFIYFFEIYRVDSILTIVFSLYVLQHSFPLLKKSFLSLMDANTTDVPLSELERVVKSDERVLEYHHLHIHQPSSKRKFISFHMVLKDDQTTILESQKIMDEVKRSLEKLGFNHVLIQVDANANALNHVHCQLNDVV